MEAGRNGQHGLEASKNLLFWLVRSSILVPEYSITLLPQDSTDLVSEAEGIRDLSRRRMTIL
jgi:hypothetical protein